VDGSASRKYGGTGLGLSICERLVKLMGGEIGVVSQPGSGSTFWMELPFAVLEGTDENDQRGPSNRVRTLVVDDNPVNLMIFQELLASWDVPCHSATNATAALAELERCRSRDEPLELVICDLKMPEVDGLELARIIRKQHDLPLILVASLGPDGIGKGGPFDGVLRKPVRSADLARLIDRVIDGFIERTPPPRQRLRLPSAPPPRGHLLVAEDNPINQEVMLELLRALGYRADLVDTGRKALEATAKNDYALVLMDCQMPDLDGYAATQQIRQRETSTGQRVPIVAVTAHALVGDRERALAAGMDDYLIKPIDRNALSRMLKRWIDEPEAAERVSGLEIDPQVSRSQAVVRLFLEHAPKQIERIRVAAESSDSAAVREAAHLLKGSCVAFGAPKMADVCRALENDPADRHALCLELEQSYAAIAASVRHQAAAR
jgi:CheY-like chemotaxis protein